MSNLADYEKEGLCDFFKSHDDTDVLVLLAKSLTKNTITAETVGEALNIVYLHGGSTSMILNKKVIKKEILFKYLHRNEISVSQDFTKLTLIQQIQNFWKEKFSETQNSNRLMLPTNNDQYQSEVNQIDENKEVSIDSSTYPIHMLARKFSEWFFSSCNEDKLKVQDFWPDTVFDLRMIDTSKNSIEDHHSSTNINVLESILNVRRNYNIFFNPNLNHEGVQGRLDSHGLVLVLCCGTLHVNNLCVGLFESTFGLIRDPSEENNWKIKNFKLQLKSSNIVAPPSLMDSETLQEILSLPEPSGSLD